MSAKFAEWEGASGRWYVSLFMENAVPEKWYVAWRLTDLSFENYIKMLQNAGAVGIKYYPPSDCLIYYFSTRDKAHAFVLERNRFLKKKGLK